MLIFIAPFPPPIGGASKNSKILHDAIIDRGVDVKKYDLVNTKQLNHSINLYYVLYRIVNLTKILIGLFIDRDACKSLYMVSPGGASLPFFVLYILIASISGIKIFMHHRSYGYLNKYSPSMALISLYRRGVEHIFLSEGMREKFRGRYGPVKSRVVSNLSTLDVPIRASPRTLSGKDRPISIGFISNLTIDKGFDIVVDAFCQVATRSNKSHFNIAGEASGPLERELLFEAQSKLGPRLHYWGEVHGCDKTRMLAECDIIVFPTRFKQEAQPNVIFEALAQNCAVISTDLGCIPDMLHKTGYEAIPHLELSAVRLVDAIQNEIDSLDAERKYARNLRLIRQQKTNSEKEYLDFVGRLCEASKPRSDGARGMN